MIKIARQGYDEPVTIPKAPQAVVDDAIGWAVKEGKLWLTHGPTSLLSEEIPAGLLSDDARLQSPPAPIPATDVLAANLPDAWTGGTATALAIADALSAEGRQAPAVGDGSGRDRRGLSGPLPGADGGFRPLAVRLRRGREGDAQASRVDSAADSAASTTPAPPPAGRAGRLRLPEAG